MLFNEITVANMILATLFQLVALCTVGKAQAELMMSQFH